MPERTKKPFSNVGMLAILIVVVCATVLAVHWPVLSARAISIDDDQYLTSNMLVQNPSWTSVKRFLTEVLEPSTVGGYYQPLAMISLMTDCALGAGVDNLMPFHRTSLILHTLNTALVVVLLYLLFGRVWIAAGVGLLFGLHPMTIETIAWVSERKTLAAAFFAFLSLNLYVLYARRGSWKFYVSCLLAYVLALMSKPITVPLPGVMLLLDYWPLRRLNWRAILEKLSFFTVSIIGAVIAYISQSRTASTVLPTEYGIERVPLVICHDIVFYLHKIFWPANLSSYYPFPSPFILANPAVAAGVIGTCILIPLLIISLRWTRAALTGWLIFFITILPTMQIIGFSNVVASDKFAYLPSIGILIILASFGIWCWQRGKAGKPKGILSNLGLLKAGSVMVVIAVLVLAGAEAAATRRYLSYWRNTLTLSEYMLELTPGDPQVLNLRAYAFQKEGNLDQAVKNYTQAIEVSPNFVDAHNNLALVLKLQGKLTEAIDHYRKAVSIEPDNADIHYNLGNTLQSLGKFDEAISHYRQALKIKPEHIQTHHNLANALAAQGKYEEALEHYYKIINIKPLEAIILNNIGITFQKQGKLDEAIDFYTQSIQSKPDFSEAHYNLIYALAVRNRLEDVVKYYREVLHTDIEIVKVYNFFGMGLQSRGQFDKAVEQFQKATQVKPDFVEAYYNLGRLFEKQNKLEEAVIQYCKALQFKPEDVELHLKVGNMLASQNKLDEAIGHFSKAIRLEPDNAEAHYNMGMTLMMTDQPREAIKHFNQAIHLNPSRPEPAIWLARILATYPDPEVQDPNNAVRIAKQAAELTKYQDPVVLETLAASYAAAGKFDDAVRSIQEALALVGAVQNNQLENRLRYMMEQYKQKQIKIESEIKTRTDNR